MVASTSKAAATGKAPKTDSVAGGKAAKKATAAPRPRKWDYGIKPDATIVRATFEKDDKGETKVPVVKADLKADWERTEKGGTCQQYFDNGGSRHGLRVLCRRKMITIKHTDGSVYPKEYVAPAPAPKAKAVKKDEKAA